MHFQPMPGNEKPIADLTKLVGDNELTKQMNDEETENDKYEVFEAVTALVHAAHELYCEEDMPFDTMISELCDSLDKLKGKEKELIAMEPDESGETDEED